MVLLCLMQNIDCVCCINLIKSHAWYHISLITFQNESLPCNIVQDNYMSRYQQGWISCINKEFYPNLPNKLKSYASFKTTFSMENYVLSLPISKRRSFTKLRVSSHRLAIETGRYTRPITPRSQRFCNHCTQHVLGDEKHFLLSCPKFAVQRKALFDDLEVLGNIRNGKDFKTFLQWWTMDMVTSSLLTKFANLSQTVFHCSLVSLPKILVWSSIYFMSIASPTAHGCFPLLSVPFMFHLSLYRIVECLSYPKRSYSGI